MASLNSYSSWTVRYTASELTSLLQKWGGVNASVESLTLTYSDLGNVIQVKVNYTNGESSTIRQRSTDLRNLFGLPSIRFTINGAEAEPGSPSGGSLSGEGLSGRSRLYTISGAGALSREGRERPCMSSPGRGPSTGWESRRGAPEETQALWRAPRSR